MLARLLILAVLAGLAWFVWHRNQQALPAVQNPGTPKTEQGNSNAGNTGNTPNTAQAPAYVLETLQFIRRNGEAPDGFVGGREFQNREKRLPAKASDGKRIRYSEWDVHPKTKGQTRRES